MAPQPDFFEDGAGQENAAREALARRWFALTRERLPALARERDWPVSEDHCFMRILLDNACGGAWREFVKAPAYRHAPLEVLERAVALGEAVERGEADLWALNERSLVWRGKGARTAGGFRG
ncbi:MAG: GCN5-related N-acetyltransferase [Pseudomonadota bacterium]